MKAFFVLIILALIGAALGGYVANIVELVHHTYAPMTTIVKVVGIFVPFVGAVLGWIN